MVAHLAKFRSDDIEKAISSIPAFKNYKLNSATGSIVIEYDPMTVNPKAIDALFSDSEQAAEQACYSIAEQLDLNGERS
ncbi:hypothetical protein A9237_13980 [Vibrio owensii]|nr:hypothetical protein A9237_13980 [Vibrio owensii]KIP68376.1 hypothetical protein SN10_18830 [Vibrio harveyi]